MKYENIKKTDDLLKYMEENIEYGFCDKDGNKYRETDSDFSIQCQNNWRLLSPKELLENKIGHCWDQVELERDWFLKHNYEIKTIFIYFLNSNLPTHTYLMYKEGDKWYWFEHSDYINKGIHVFESFEELVKNQYERHLKYVSNFTSINNDLLKKLRIYEYSNLPYGIDSQSFFKLIIDKVGKDITNVVL